MTSASSDSLIDLWLIYDLYDIFEDGSWASLEVRICLVVNRVVEGCAEIDGGW